jgi:4-hydroxybenzoate polyprenyltransferase
MPRSWVPYAELARLDRPTGIYLFFFPHLFGTLYAACLQDTGANPIALIYTNIVLLLGTVFMRGAACAWNDNMDQEFDRQVERCHLRSVARGAVSTK